MPAAKARGSARGPARIAAVLPVSAALLAMTMAPAPSTASPLPFADTGHLYVSMWTADEIAVFAEDGSPITRFSAEGLDGPRGLAFHPLTGELWVAGEFSDALYVFDGEHSLLRRVEHPDFNEPVGITFARVSPDDDEYDVFVSNSNANEIMVFNEDGQLLRRFGDPSLRDPNCSALLPDGTLFVANRLGGSTGSSGAVARFDADNAFEFDFTSAGISSTMAVARDPNVVEDTADDTLWVTSGAGTLGIHEFDTSGNLLRSILPADIPNAASLVPQGIAFADDGRFHVVSFNDEVVTFDGEGNYVSRFPTGSGTSRSTAFRRCDARCADSSTPDVGVDTQAADIEGSANASNTGGSGGGTLALWMLSLLLAAGCVRRIA